ncbi:hypothetical protein DFH94DRAFT_264306 [Russula ochroleuca]|uniref:Uncharacterized protein n=1 Tax=Russula ochroleuca TaxID=152965 RepID=A0A9P5N352_9AGAM|nr:hypothetical protein DFH94DRAFT_264306 [Russula ochroleuca]
MTTPVSWGVWGPGSANIGGLSLVCTEGTPVTDMLAHSPPLPLVIDYFNRFYDITAKDEGETILALKQRDRVRRIRLWMPPTGVQKLIVVTVEEYPILEYLVIMPRIKDDSTILQFPDTLQAPHLRCLSLSGFALPTGSRLLTTAVGLVMLELVMIHPSTYFHPNTLLRWLSSMPQLKALVIHFSSPVPNHTVEQRSHMPITTPVALPNLRWFWFRGIRAYLEAVVPRITAPRLAKLEITFFNQVTFFVPRLLQFMNTTENLRLESAKFEFSYERVDVEVYPHKEAEMSALHIEVDCWHLDWQVSSAAQISNSHSQMFSAVEHLSFEHDEHFRSSEEHNEVDRTELRKLLRSFSNVKTLYVDDGLIKDFSHCLRLEDPLELLPELQELIYSVYPESGTTGDSFTSFIDARQNAGRPITLVSRSPRSETLDSRRMGGLVGGKTEPEGVLDT